MSCNNNNTQRAAIVDGWFQAYGKLQTARRLMGTASVTVLNGFALGVDGICWLGWVGAGGAAADGYGSERVDGVVVV